MLNLPSLRQISTEQDIECFSTVYQQCSGFHVPRAYYESNRVFVVQWRKQMVAGFVLGAGTQLRTLEVFAGNESRDQLYQQIGRASRHTEMCCFWMRPQYHKKIWLNFFVWFCVAFALRTYGSTRLIFGTNSARLAALYSAAPKCRLLHSDFIHQKQTFIFTGPRKDCLMGVAHILLYKINRLLRKPAAQVAGRIEYLGRHV